jgi:hypothetical protein
VAGSFLSSGHNGKKISGSELAAYYANGDLCRMFMENIDTMVREVVIGTGYVADIDDYFAVWNRLRWIWQLCSRINQAQRADRPPSSPNTRRPCGTKP